VNKQDYLSELIQHLKLLTQSELQIVLGDYEEHFANALYGGRDEAEVIRSLGSPRLVSKEILAQYKFHKAVEAPSLNKVTKAVLAITGLAAFNIIPVLLPFALSLLIFGIMYSISIMLLASPLILLIQDSMSHTFLYDLFWIFGLLGLGILMMLGLIRLTHWYYQQVLRYLRNSIQRLERG